MEVFVTPTVTNGKNNVLKKTLEDFSYTPDNIFNVYKTGFFKNVFQTILLLLKDTIVMGGKNSKQRITVLLSANMNGN